MVSGGVLKLPDEPGFELALVYVGKGGLPPNSSYWKKFKGKIGTQFVFLAGKTLKNMKSIRILGRVPLLYPCMSARKHISAQRKNSDF